MVNKIAVLVAAVLYPCSLLAQFPGDTEHFKTERRAMVSVQIQKRGISDTLTLNALLKVPRHLFVPASQAGQAYTDRPLPIGEGQTISQPYIVALMTESLSLKGNERVLEIGTGSGYQAAVLSALVKQVYTIEIKRKLQVRSKSLLAALAFKNIETRHGDGYFGWEKAAPFDCIMITAAVDHIPPPLLKQLKNGGRLILPLGNPFHYQNLTLVTKRDQDFMVRQITGVLFVPLTGFALDRKR